MGEAMADEKPTDGTVKVNLQTIVMLLVLLLQTFQTWMQQNTSQKADAANMAATMARVQAEATSERMKAVQEENRETRRLMGLPVPKE
jgi:hypothetical protein